MAVSVSILAASAAVRVASLNLCTDEYLLLLARPEQVASVSRLSQDPADSPLWRLARHFHANRGDLETTLSARPTLMLTMGGGGRASGLIARGMGLKTLDLPYPSTIADVERNMTAVARALGTSTRLAAWRARLGRLGISPKPQRDTMFLGVGGNTVPADSISAGWMRLAGLRQRPLPGSRASLEQITLHPPAVLLRSSYRRTERSLGQYWLDHPLARPARSKILWTDGRPWTCAGPLMLAEIERLRTAR